MPGSLPQWQVATRGLLGPCLIHRATLDLLSVFNSHENLIIRSRLTGPSSPNSLSGVAD